MTNRPVRDDLHGNKARTIKIVPSGKIPHNWKAPQRTMGVYVAIPWKEKPESECPDSARYKACGNSMCVNVMQWLGYRIQAVENTIKKDPLCLNTK